MFSNMLDSIFPARKQVPTETASPIKVAIDREMVLKKEIVRWNVAMDMPEVIHIMVFPVKRPLSIHEWFVEAREAIPMFSSNMVNNGIWCSAVSTTNDTS